MNQYGAMAETHYRTFLPDQYTQLDPGYFESLGQQIEDEIDQVAASIAGDDPAGETYLGKLGRLNMARQMARERVLAQMLPDPDTTVG